MLKDRIQKHIQANEVIFEEEKQYMEKQQIKLTNVVIEDSGSRFADAYIERCDKETENTVKSESSSFLAQPIEYLNKHKQEFVYLESKWFELIGVDAVSLEADDVFGTYDVMLGLRLQKKYEKILKNQLNQSLHGDDAKFDLMFSQEDGLWDLNFALNYVEGFQENMSFAEAYQIIYRFLFQLVEAAEEQLS